MILKIKLFYHEKKLYKDYEKKPKEEKEEKLDIKDDLEDDEDEKDIIDTGNDLEKFEDFSKDKTFQKFQKVLDHTPEQVIRTQFDMEVLWTTDKPEYLPKGTKIKDKVIGKVEIQKCKCGAPRIAEVQLMPTSIYILNVEDFNHLKGNEGLDFGTAIFYTCSKKCGKDEYMFEPILIQPPIE